MKLTTEFVGVDKLALKESSTNELKRHINLFVRYVNTF